RGLGATVRATSPTFVLVNQYQGRVVVHHVDAYRTNSMTELIDLGLLELMGGPGVTIIEWADKLRPLLPPDTIHVHIGGVGDEPRSIPIRLGASALYRPRRIDRRSRLAYEIGMAIDRWPEAERPRERLYWNGPEALADAELLAIQLGSGTRGKSAIEVAREV